MENIEIECRFLEINKESLLKKLAALGAEDHGERHLEEVILYDKDRTWIEDNKRLRLRKENNSVKLSYKNQTKHTIDGTIEIEFGVDDMKQAELFLETLGFPAYRHQEKMRHTLMLGDVTFDIDTWPRIPTYVELEGPSEEAIRKAAELVGFDWNDAVFHNPSWVIENTYGIPVRKMTWFTFDRFE